MRSCLLFWFSLFFGLAQADTLRNKTFTKPLILKGNKPWVIENCRFEVGEGKVGLEVGCKRRVQIQHCTFIGFKEKGIGVITFQDAEVTHCNFKNLASGIQVESKGKSKIPNSSYSNFNISQNQFTNNQTAISLLSGQFNLNMKCNVFEQTTPIPGGGQHIGLRIGSGVELYQNKIGGDGTPNSQGSPNSNYFPRVVDPITGEIGSFPNYFAVYNESENPITYYKYGNEDLGGLFPQNTSNEVSEMAITEISVTKTNLMLWCMEGNPMNHVNIGFGSPDDCLNMTPQQFDDFQPLYIPANWRFACQGGPIDEYSFPLPKPGKQHDETISQLQSLAETGIYLGQSQPNPANNKVSIPFILPNLAAGAVLEIFELGTGKVLHSKALKQSGYQTEEIDLSHWASGIYGYRLVPSKGKAPSPRKLVIVK